MLVYSAADFEDFQVERPDMPPSMEADLEPVVRLLAQEPLAVAPACHLQRDDHARPRRVREGQPRHSVQRPALVHRPRRDHRRPQHRADRKLGGGIAVQHRMAYQGEYFVERYGNRAAERTPPIRRMLEMGVPVGAGTDATRVASYNPWVSLSWLVTGKTRRRAGTLSGGQPARSRDRAATVDRGQHLVFDRARQEGPDQAGPARRSRGPVRRLFLGARENIQDITSVLTLLGGKPVYGDVDFKDLAPPLPPAMPDWSPVRLFGGYRRRGVRTRSGTASTPSRPPADAALPAAYMGTGMPGD